MKKQSRTHTINLTEQAEAILRELKKQKRTFSGWGWFGKYVSEKLIEDFGGTKLGIKAVKAIIIDIQKERDEKEEEMRKWKNVLDKLKAKHR